MRNKDFDIWMIRIKGDYKSELYAEYCAKSWTDAGFHVNFFDAITPETVYRYKESKLFHPDNRMNDQEKSVLVSMLRLWRKCVETNRPFLILEHDAYLEKKVDAIQYNPHVDVTFFGQHCMEAVLFKPSFCKDFIRWIHRLGGQVKNGEIHRGILYGPFAMVERYLGCLLDCHHHNIKQRPHTKYLGPQAPVRVVLIEELGSSIVHSGAQGGNGKSSDTLIAHRRDPWIILKLDDVLKKVKEKK